MPELRTRVAESASSFRSVFANTNLRRLHLALTGSVVGHWAYAVAVSVYAYDAAGAEAVGLLWFVRMIPAALVSPFAAMLGDRFPRHRVMLGSDLVRVVLIACATAAVLFDAPTWVVFALATAIAIAATPFDPAFRGILPSLARTPNELTAANVVAGAIESVGFLLGPALGGLLFAVADTGVVFAVTGGLVAWSAFFVSRVDAPRAERHADAERTESVRTEAAAGFVTIARDGRLRLLTVVLVATMIVDGAVEVLIVAASIDLLGLGESGVGWLSTAFGAGAIVGAFLAAGLVGVRRLSLPFVTGAVLWGVPVALIGVFGEPGSALLLLALVGIGSTLGDVAGMTLVQRAVPEHVLSRVFGVLQFLWLAGIGVGALLVTPLIGALDVRGALIATGLFLPAVVAVTAVPLIRVDAEASAPDAGLLALLRGVPMLAALPGPTLERLTANLERVELAAGATLMRQGDAGDRFYVVADGEVDVVTDGRVVTTLGPGSYVGEIALLRDVPRTAAVSARTAVRAYALERDLFLAAVTGHAPATEAADSVVSSRLAGLAGSRRGASAL